MDLIRELFDRIEDLTSRLDRLTSSSGSGPGGSPAATRRPGMEAFIRLDLNRRLDKKHVDSTNVMGESALDEAGRMQSSEPEPTRPSPYLDARGAAAYLGITLDSLYGIVERKGLVPLRGPKMRYRFTESMLDDYLRRKGSQG